MTDACLSAGDCLAMRGKTPLSGSYIPAALTTTASAYLTCADDSFFEEAVGGCDQITPYACGTSGGAHADLTINPWHDTRDAGQCLIHSTAGADSLDMTQFPYRIQAGAGNPVITSGFVTTSTSIATVPIYDSTNLLQSTNKPTITIVGFLQVFINQVSGDNSGSFNVTVLNVAGCSNTATNPAVSGTSPVPIRLITPQ